MFSSTFFQCRSFSPCIGGHEHFLFSHCRYKIVMLFFQQKKCLLCCLSLSLSPFFSLSFNGLPPTFAFLCLSFPLFSKFVDMTINLSLILQTTRIQKQFPLFVFVFIVYLVVSALHDSGGYAISRQNNLDLRLGCHTCRSELFYIGIPVVRTDGRSLGHVITKFYRMGRFT